MTETDCHREIMNRKRMSYIPAVHRTQGFCDFVAHFFPTNGACQSASNIKIAILNIRNFLFSVKI